MAASRWIIDNLNAQAPNNGEVVLAGDSAGGNLTLSTAARMPDEPRLRGCMMIYPVTQHYHADMRSYTEHAKSGPLTTPIMRWFTDTYLNGAGRSINRNHVPWAAHHVQRISSLTARDR